MSVLSEKLKDYKLILASASPRRKEILSMLGLNFEIKTKKTLENYPQNLIGGQIPEYLANLKASAFEQELAIWSNNTIVIAADTIVYIDKKVLGKPHNRQEAIDMLNLLNDNKHSVYTGVCLKSMSKTVVFHATTDVWFRNLSADEIEFYVDNFKPYDKAGAYAVQEWIGAAAISRIEGSYYNVVGLPSQMLYTELIKFVQ